MSYARFGWDNSDVYIYLTDALHGIGLQCCGCFLDDTFTAYTSGEMLEHLDEHLAAGHVVPQDTIDAIKGDYPELDKELS